MGSHEVSDVLKEHIDSVNIPKSFGGDFHFDHGSLPALDGSIRDRLSWNSPQQSLPVGPLKFCEAANKKLEAMAVGHLGGLKRNDVIATIDLGEPRKLSDSRERTQEMCSLVD